MRGAMDATKATMLVAATGGHLAQLKELAPDVVRPGSVRVWVTFDTPQSRSLLTGETVHYVRFTSPRDWLSITINIFTAVRLLLRYRPERIVSTGSGVALAFLPVARLLAFEAWYIESAARTTGPSMTGRALARIPGIKTFTQYSVWADERWRYRYSVFSHYRWKPGHSEVEPSSARIVVMLGSLDYQFDRLVRRIQEIVPKQAEIVWQLGSTAAPSDLVGQRFSIIPAEEIAQLAAHSTAIVAHAGCGSALTALDAGVAPILVPRREKYGEHVDDHQEQIAEELSNLSLGTYVEVESLTTEMLLRDYRGVTRRGSTP